MLRSAARGATVRLAPRRAAARLHTVVAPVFVPVAGLRELDIDSSRPRGIIRANPRQRTARYMCTETSDTADHAVMYLEDSEGNVIDEATLLVGPDSVTVMEDGEAVMEWDLSELRVADVKPAEDDNSMVTVDVDGDEYVFEAEPDLVQLLRSKKSAGKASAESSSETAAKQPAVSSSSQSGWAPKDVMKGSEWKTLSPGQCFGQLQYISRGRRGIALRNVNHVLLNCLDAVRNGDDKAFKIALQTMQLAKRKLVQPSSRTLRIFFLICKEHGDLNAALAVFAPQPPMRVLQPLKAPTQPKLAASDEADANADDAGDEAGEAEEEEEEEEIVEEEEEEGEEDEDAIVTRADGAALHWAPYASNKLRLELMQWAVQESARVGALKILATAEEAIQYFPTKSVVDQNLVTGAVEACVQAGDVKKALLLLEHYTLIGLLTQEGQISKWPTTWWQHKLARKMMSAGSGMESESGAAAPSVVRIQAFNAVLRCLEGENAEVSGEDGGAESGLPVYGNAEDVELIRRLIKLSGVKPNDETVLP